MASLQQTPTGRPLSGRKSRFLKRRVLFPHCPASFTEVWSIEENKSLVEFVLLHGDPHVCPSHSRSSNFWKCVSDFVAKEQKYSSGIRYILYHYNIHLLPLLFIHFCI